MAALWGSRGRPETNQYAKLCADRQIEHQEELDRKWEVARNNRPNRVQVPRLGMLACVMLVAGAFRR